MPATETFAIAALDMSRRLHHFSHRLQAEMLFWGIALVLLLEDDVAMLACMFS